MPPLGYCFPILSKYAKAPIKTAKTAGNPAVLHERKREEK
jgi:hypothetical protein